MCVLLWDRELVRVSLCVHGCECGSQWASV